MWSRKGGEGRWRDAGEVEATVGGGTGCDNGGTGEVFNILASRLVCVSRLGVGEMEEVEEVEHK